MKIVLPIILFSLVACNQQVPSKAVSKEHRDSVAALVAIRLKENERQFSNPRNITEDEQSKAYASVKFGMSRKEAEKLQNFYGFTEIGNVPFTIQPDYFKDSLYQLTITSIDKSANFFVSDVRIAWQTLIDVITEKYGPPDVDDPYPTLLSMRTKKTAYQKRWRLGDKIINIGVGEEEYTYFAECWIYFKPLRERMSRQLVIDNIKSISADKDKF